MSARVRACSFLPAEKSWGVVAFEGGGDGAPPFSVTRAADRAPNVAFLPKKDRLLDEDVTPRFELAEIYSVRGFPIRIISPVPQGERLAHF